MSQPELPLARLRILVVDDNEDARLLMSALLASHGAVVVTAGSAGEARVELDGPGTIQLLVCDVGMPETDGMTFIRSLRAGTRHATLPAIAYTAFESSDDRAAVLEAGFDDHVRKSADFGAVVSAIVKVLGQRSPSAARGPADSDGVSPADGPAEGSE